jgi:GTP:adenosylcobinamide-phosphate guanylyltransferase
VALDFDLNSVSSSEFGVGIDSDDPSEQFRAVPVNEEVQYALQDMASDTLNAMEQSGESPTDYQPSEKYSGQEYVLSSLTEPYTAMLRSLHRANNLPVDASILDNPGAIYCYFARFKDSRNKRLTAIRRATQFKGLLKSNNRLLRLISDTLQIVEDQTFKLDRDFDLLIDQRAIHIWRPSGFEYLADLQETIREAVPENIASIQSDIAFVNFETIQEYASSHTRAARHLASIRSLRETENISQALLTKACRLHGVESKIVNGKIVISAGSEMAFLDILDRRIYQATLVKNAPERYRAGSRKRL